jgi:hypothetical protein
MHRTLATSSLSLMLLALSACGGGGGGSAIDDLPALVAPSAPQVKVSAATPFASNCGGNPDGGVSYREAEAEPHLAVDPGNPNHLVASWQQDRWSNGGSRGLMSATSFDGGATWTRVAVPTSACTGGASYERASDPWTAVGASGTIYAISLSFDSAPTGGANAMLVARSLDGGLSYGAPTTLIADGAANFNDKQMIAADPNDAAYAYAVWDRLTFDNRGPAMLARTIDGGATWQAAVEVFDPGVGAQTIGNTIVVRPDGSLTLFFTQIAGGTASLRAMRSSDHGATWSAPTSITNINPVGATANGTGTAVRDGSIIGTFATGPSGEVVAVWQDSIGATDGIFFRRSTDGGATWGTIARITALTSTQSFTPTVAIAGDGAIGVAFFDDRDDGPSTASFRIARWLITSSDGGATWSETRLTQPFDLNLAPNARGLFVGDYHGLVASGSSFVPLFVQTNNSGTANRTDVYVLPAGTVPLVGSSPAKLAVAVPPVADAARARIAVERALAQRRADRETLP